MLHSNLQHRIANSSAFEDSYHYEEAWGPEEGLMLA